MMSEMVERVARAIAFAQGGKITGPSRHRASDEFGWTPGNHQMDQYAEKHWPEFMTAAQFAISVMRDPPDEVLLGCGEPYGGEIDRSEGLQIRRDAWNQMIDAALTSCSVGSPVLTHEKGPGL